MGYSEELDAFTVGNQRVSVVQNNHANEAYDSMYGSGE